MITNTGKNIIAKYMLGHTSSYASHIAIGCGATPLGQLDDPDFYADIYEVKENLDFEMFRVPITSRGYIKEDGITYVVFTAELPTTERYGMTEIGIYSAGANPEAGVADSKLIHSFSQLENWEHHTQSGATSIPIITDALDNGDNFIFNGEEGFPVFRVSSDNATFLYEDRVARYEVPRFLDSSILMIGNSSTISVNSDGTLIPDDTLSSHIHLTGVSYNFDQNAPTDEIKLAFSLVNRQGQDPTDENSTVSEPEEIRIVLQFVSVEGGDNQAATMDIYLRNGFDGIDFGTDRYFVITKKLEELRKTIGFSWDQMTIAKAYVSIIDGNGLPSGSYYIAFDGLRLENKTDIHPLYGLTGYSVVKNDNAYPIIKSTNSSSFAEFRFALQLDEYLQGS